MSRETSLLTRRSALKQLAALFGGAMTATQLGLLAENAEALGDDAESRFFDQRQFAMLSRIADLIIPQTDTPGALGVGVPRFIDMMFAEWASEERQSTWIAGLAEIDERARAAGMDHFAAGSKEQQVALLERLDREYFEGGREDTFFSAVKKMVIFSFYSTEIGATVELRYQPVPGDYLPCIPLDTVGRAWFWNGYSYGL